MFGNGGIMQISKIKSTDIKKICRAAAEFLFTFKGAWAFIFLCWLPVFLAAWPGVYMVDNIFQMRWYLEGEISAHHPILYTYLLGAALEMGKELFGTWEAGMSVLSLLQMIFLSAVLAYMVKVLKQSAGMVCCLLSVLFYALIPYNPVSALTTTKDTIFAGMFLLVLIRTYQIVCDPAGFFRSWKKIGMYVLLVFLMCAFRNTGIYIFIFSLPALLIVCRTYWKKALVMGMCVVLVWGIFTGPVYGLLDVKKGSSAEMLSAPIQQLARTMLAAPEEFTEEQWELAETYMPTYELYAPRVSDFVKDSFNSGLFDEDPIAFFKLWIQMGIKCPVVYIEAFFDTNIGFWNPFMQYPDPGTFLDYITYNCAGPEMAGSSWEGQVFIQRHSLLPGLSGFYEKMTETGGYNRIPGMRFVYSIAVAFWLIVAGVIVCVRRKAWNMSAPFLLLIGLWGTLMLSPVVVFRYGYPLIISLPLVWIMCGTNRSAAESEHSDQTAASELQK